MRTYIFKYKKPNFSIVNEIKKDLIKHTFYFNKQTTNKKLNFIFPLYAPKISFFRVSGLFFKNMKQNGINQSITIQSVVSKNKVKFNFSPNIPLLYIF
jgi:ribosomal protein L19